MIIGFAGNKGVGKSTAAGFLVEHGWKKCSFADPMRNMLRSFLRDYGLTYPEINYAMDNKEVNIPRLGVSYRHLMQTLGTEWGRCMVRDDIWVTMQRFKIATARLGKCKSIVYDDIRFENEADLIRTFGGKIVHIKRPGLDNADIHASESGIAIVVGDIVLDNCGNHGLLLDAVMKVIND